MPQQILTLLGFDYGTRFIGVAVGQTLTRSARPLAVVNAKSGEPNWNEITELDRKWMPDAFVVGVPIPIEEDNSDEKMTKRCRRFAMQLKKRLKKPVYTIDERLTTKEAHSQLFARKGYRGLKKTAVDKKSATIILEDWLKQSIVPTASVFSTRRRGASRRNVLHIREDGKRRGQRSGNFNREGYIEE